MAGHSQKPQVEVCDICGDRGFPNAFLYCSECSDTVVHQYCLGLIPTSIDDSFTWDCEYCCASREFEPNTSMKSGASTSTSEDICREHEGALKEEEFKMTDDTFSYPKSFTCKGKRKKRKRASFTPETIVIALEADCKRIKTDRFEDQSFSNNKVDAGKDRSTNVSANGKMEIVLFDDQPPPLCVLLPIEYQGSSEQAETSSKGHVLQWWGEETEAAVSSWMECPEEITRGLVLLVSPSGEIMIHDHTDLCDDIHSPSLITSIFKLTNNFDDFGLDNLVENSTHTLNKTVGHYEQIAQNCSIMV